MGMKLGYCLWGMPNVAIEESLPRLAALGYQGVELCVLPRFSTALETLDPGRRRLIRQLLDDNGLALTAVAAHSDMVDAEGEALEANLRRLRGAIDLAAELARPGEPPIMVSLLGGRVEEWETHRHLAVERVGALDRYAAERGVTYAIELHVGTIVDVPEKALWLLKQVNSPTLRLNFDVSHPELMGIPTEVSVPLLAPLSVHTHVKDQRGRWPNHEFLTPGEGPFDYVRFLKEMHKAGYRGFINVEVSVMRQRRPDYEPFVHAAFSYRVLDYAFQAAGVPRE